MRGREVRALRRLQRDHPDTAARERALHLKGSILVGLDPLERREQDRLESTVTTCRRNTCNALQSRIGAA